MRHIPLQSEKNIIFNSKSPGSVPAVCWVVCVCLCASASGAVGKGRKEAGSHLPTPDSTTMPPLDRPDPRALVFCCKCFVVVVESRGLHKCT